MAVDPLGIYNAKRDFKKTAEPAGKRGRKSGNSFVVQKHDATRLHWDFRLEIDGVLKSWAVTRGPSLNPADKRLSVRTGGHPLGYGTFEGTIPKGEYGGGRQYRVFVPALPVSQDEMPRFRIQTSTGAAARTASCVRRPTLVRSATSRRYCRCRTRR